MLQLPADIAAVYGLEDPVFSPVYTRHVGLAQQAFSIIIAFPLMWEWEECNGFDVTSGSTQILPSCHVVSQSFLRENTAVLSEN